MTVNGWNTNYNNNVYHRCSSCGEDLKEETESGKVWALNRWWHNKCFKCHGCSGEFLNGNYFSGPNNAPYCKTYAHLITFVKSLILLQVHLLGSSQARQHGYFVSQAVGSTKLETDTRVRRVFQAHYRRDVRGNGQQISSRALQVWRVRRYLKRRQLRAC